MKFRRTLLAFLAATLAFTACGTESGGGDADSKADGELFTIRSVIVPNVTEIFMAWKLGFFAEEGIDIEWVPMMPDGVSIYQYAEMGEVDVLAGGHPPNYARSVLAGIQTVATVPGTVDADSIRHMMYFTRADSEIKSLEDLAEKPYKVGIEGRDICPDGFLKYYLQQKGLRTDLIEFVPLTAADIMQTLDMGQIDMAASHAALYPQAEALGLVSVDDTWNMFGQKPYVGTSFRGFLQSFIDEHPDVVQGFSNACYKGRIWINNNYDLAIEVTAEEYGLDPLKIAPVPFCEDKFIEPEGPEWWMDLCEYLELWDPDAISATDLYTNDFAAQVSESVESIAARKLPQ